MKIFLVFLISFLSLWVITARADNTQIGRYMTAKDGAKPEQIDLLQQEMQVKFPESVQTVGDAMKYLLKTSGYSLIPEDKQSDALKTTLSKPLAAVDRNFGPVSLKEGLSTLAGPVFELVQDPLNRMVDFRLKPSYAKVYEKKSDGEVSKTKVSTSTTNKKDTTKDQEVSKNIIAQSFSKAAQAFGQQG